MAASRLQVGVYLRAWTRPAAFLPPNNHALPASPTHVPVPRGREGDDVGLNGGRLEARVLAQLQDAFLLEGRTGSGQRNGTSKLDMVETARV